MNLTLIAVEHLADEARLADLAADLEPSFLGEDGAEVPEEALHALLAFFGQTPRAEHRQLHLALSLHLGQKDGGDTFRKTSN